MEIDIHCPFCDEEFIGEVWLAGLCPKCNTEYWWEEDCLEDYSDCWATVEWDFKNENNKHAL